MNTFEWTFELRFAVALALGFLVGMERESSGTERKLFGFAGIRTYTIISLYGFACGWLNHINVTLALPVGMVSVGGIAVAGYLAKLKSGRIGSTSEVAALLTFIIGALTLLADIWVSMALGIITTILLSEKAELESYVEKLDKSEFLAVLKFLLVTFIILPVLPNREYTQFRLNPTRIWQIVILVSTIGFVGYFLTKKFGRKVGMALSGLLGGIVSSTAVSIATGRIAQRTPAEAKHALVASILASSVMYLRILVLLWIVNPAFVQFLWWKLIILSIIGVAMLFGLKDGHQEVPERPIPTLQNPFELKPALLFALFFVVLSVLTIYVRGAFGDPGFVALSLISGTVDADPFILSLVTGTANVERIALTGILLVVMSNTILKGLYFGTLAKDVRRAAFLRYGLWALLHLPFML